MKLSAPTEVAILVEHRYRPAGFGVKYIEAAVIWF